MTSEPRPLSGAGGKVRLYIDASLERGAPIGPNSAQAHYLLHVMRGKPGDRVSLFNGRDGEWLSRIAAAGRSGCVLECERRTRPQTDTPDVWLCFAPIKKTPADYLAQKAAELGARVLQPVTTRRTVVSRVNLERMRANAIEAAEQSDRLTVPEIREPLALEKLLANWPPGRRVLFCDEGGDAPPIAEALRAAAPCPWAVLTGPEGGFELAERDRVRACAFAVPVSLGPRVLRADTAALAALSVWQALQGDWRQLPPHRPAPT